MFCVVFLVSLFFFYLSLKSRISFWGMDKESTEMQQKRNINDTVPPHRSEWKKQKKNDTTSYMKLNKFLIAYPWWIVFKLILLLPVLCLFSFYFSVCFALFFPLLLRFSDLPSLYFYVFQVCSSLFLRFSWLPAFPRSFSASSRSKNNTNTYIIAHSAHNFFSSV